MKALIIKASVGALLAATLAGCGGGGGGDGGVVTPPPPPSARLEDGFGAGFATSYRASPNTDPRDPATSDINGVSVTTDPVAVP